jgi:general secretion pathway protein G
MRKGFTLIELIVVIAIIAVLAAIVAPSAFKAIEKGKVSATIGDFKSIKTSAMAYYADTGQWPASMSNGSGLVTNDSVSGWDGPYLEKWPARGAWGGCYTYTRNTTHRWVSLANVTNNSAAKVDQQVDGGDGSGAGSVTWNSTGLTIVVSND